MEVLRPYGIVIDGKLELGLEFAFESEWRIRPHTGIPEPFVLSSPFLNAHSHFEYRGLMGSIPDVAYWPWIRELTALKKKQPAQEVASGCLTAALENRASGVINVLEHSDRPGSAEAMMKAGLSGRIYLELITFFESLDPELKRQSVLERLTQSTPHIEFGIAPHATYTVDESTLKWAGALKVKTSIHVAETPAERLFFESGEGPIASFYRENSVPFEVRKCSPVRYLEDCGLLGQNTQLVHCCDVTDEDIDAIARSGSEVAHCPRSNLALGCPTAPIRRMLEAGIEVRLGMDSAASSGPIDMFAEIRACVASAIGIREPIDVDAAWRLASAALPSQVACDGFVLAIDVSGCHSTEELLGEAVPERCRLIPLNIP